MRGKRLLLSVLILGAFASISAQTAPPDLEGVRKALAQLQGAFGQFKSDFTKLQETLSEVSRDVPVGTVIMSNLDWDHFQTTTQNNSQNPAGNVWTPKYSKWAPADGRPVADSSFGRLAGIANVPDLRGVFARGLNKFDPREGQPVSADQKDPDVRQVASFQGDLFKSHSHGGSTGTDAPDHTHNIVGYKYNVNYGGDNTSENLTVAENNFKAATSGASTRHTHSISAEGGTETRPKNVALYYYVRIN